MPCSKESALELLTKAHRAGRLGHAHIITGAVRSGKSWVAHGLAAEVLGCSRQAVLAHPDAHFVQPESKSRRILTEQIRRLELSIHRKPLIARAKVAIITDADRLQPAAANAFLKTLEEPPEGSLLLLTTILPEAVLETILSRCMETSLHGADQALDHDAVELLEEFARCVLDPAGAGVAAAFRLTRHVQQALGNIRERVASEYQAVFKAEAGRLKNIADAGDWIEEREEQIKAMTEAAALRERDRILGALFVALGGALRASTGGEAPHPVCARIAGAFPSHRIFAMIEAFETMRRRLALTVNEPLALECGFLDIVRASRAAKS